MIAGIPQFEKFFREAAGLDIDKSDIRRIDDLANRQMHRFLVMARRAAKMNGRDIILEADLPITAGLEERMRKFETLNEELKLADILEKLAELPPIGADLSAEVEEMLPTIMGAMILSMAELFPVVDPHVKNPSSEHWDRVKRIYDILM